MTTIIRRFKKLTLFFLIFGFALPLLVTGCQQSERQRVRTVSDQFLDAMAQKEWSRAKPLLTEKARDAMGDTNLFASGESAEKKHPDASGTEEYTVGEPKLDDGGLIAAVPVTFTRKGEVSQGTLRLRREDGEWRVRALRLEGTGDSPGMTLDFENPESALLGAAFRAFGEGMGEMITGLRQGMGAFLKGVEKGNASPTPETEGTVKIEEHSSGR